MNTILNYDISITPSRTQLLPGKKCYLEINRSIYRLITVSIVEEETSKSSWCYILQQKRTINFNNGIAKLQHLRAQIRKWQRATSTYRYTRIEECSTQLFDAIYENKFKQAKILIDDDKVDVNIKNECGDTPLIAVLFYLQRFVPQCA
jgi:hypothetical protein